MNIDQNNAAEQERANRLAEALDRLMSGEPPESADVLLSVAQGLVAVPLEPSPAAVARFDQQVNRWFTPPTPRTLSRVGPRIPLIAAGLGVAAALIVAGIVMRLTVFAPPSLTPTVIVTPTATTTPTAIPTRTATSAGTAFLPVGPSTIIVMTSAATEPMTSSPTITVTPTATMSAMATTSSTTTASLTSTLTDTAVDNTPTPQASLEFAQVIISGPIDSIQGANISIMGQDVQVQGGSGGLCVGDWVNFAARMLPSTNLQVARSAITVVSSNCAATRVPTAIPNPTGNGDNGDDNGDEHHGGHHGS